MADSDLKRNICAAGFTTAAAAGAAAAGLLPTASASVSASWISRRPPLEAMARHAALSRISVE
jgi:hypothetical protein